MGKLFQFNAIFEFEDYILPAMDEDAIFIDVAIVVVEINGEGVIHRVFYFGGGFTSSIVGNVPNGRLPKNHDTSSM